jgi:hypothetical protein
MGCDCGCIWNNLSMSILRSLFFLCVNNFSRLKQKKKEGESSVRDRRK